MLEDLLAGLGGGLSTFGRGLLSAQDEEERRQQIEQARRDRINREGVEDMYRQAEIAESARRYAEQQRQARAGIAASQLGPNQEIDDLTYSFLRDTPYEARIASSRTLPTDAISPRDVALTPGGDDLGSFSLPATAGGDQVRTWRPSWSESRALAQDAALSDVMHDPKVAPYAGRIRAGLGTSELPNERAEREAAGDQADTTRALAVEGARAKSILDEIRLRDQLSDHPGGGRGTQAENLWKRYGAEYESFVREHANKQKQRQDEAARLQKPDPLNPGKTTASEVFYEEPLSFDQWLKQRKGIDPYGQPQARSSAIPVTPRPSHTATPTDAQRVAMPGDEGAGATGPQVGQTVTVKGKSYRVGKVYPDGSWDPMPELARSH